MKFHPTWIASPALLAALTAALLWWLSDEVTDHQGKPAIRADSTAAPAALPEPDAIDGGVAGASPARARAEPVAFTPPAADAIPDNEFGEVVRLGRDIFVNTQIRASRYVGNGLNCVNCHLDAGRKADSGPLWAAYTQYPAYRDKNKKVNSYEDRLAGCFTFSMNGTPPPYGSPEMVALVTYSYWLARGAPTGAELRGRGYPKLEEPPASADARRGARVFEAQCAICHGAQGQGTRVEDRFVFPPLWGKNSYNAGAGMNRVETAAAFIKANMPLGKGGTLSLQEAWDVAKFMNSHERPSDPRKR